MKQKLLLALLALLTGVGNLSAQTDVTDQYITNAGFEDLYQRFLDINTDRGVEKPLGWSVEWYQDNSDKNGMTYVAESMTQDNKTWKAKYQKAYFARMRWGNATLYLRQTLQNLRPGSYTLSFSAAAHSTNNSNRVQVSVAGQTQTISLGTNEDGSWTDYSINFTITENTPYATIEFKAERAGDLLKVGVDEFKLLYDGSSYYEAILSKAQALYDNNKDWAENGLEVFNSAIISNTGKTSVEDINSAITALEEAMQAFKDANSTDVTVKIVNPNFDSNISGWTVTGGDGNNFGHQTSTQTNFTGGFLEKWRNGWNGGYNQKNFDVYQQINDLPNGEYTAKAYILAQMQGTKETLGNDYKNKKHGGPYYIDDKNGVWFYASSGDNTNNIWANTFTPSFGDTSGGVLRCASVNVVNGSLTIGFKGIGSPNGGTELGTYANWIACDTWTLSYFGFDPTTLQTTIASLQEEATSLLCDDDYVNVIGVERTNLVNASVLNPEVKKASLEAAIATITEAIATFKASKNSYDAFATEKEYASSLGVNVSDEDPATSSEAKTMTNAIKVNEYNYVKENFPKDFTNTYLSSPTTNTFNQRSEQHWSGETRNYFDFWDGSSADRELTYKITLPAGRYIIKAAGRGQINTASSVTISDGTTSIPFVMKGDTGLGINKNGETSFDENDQYGFANNNTGRGWEWRYLLMNLSEEQEVTLSLTGHVENSWIGACDFTLLTTKDNTAITAAAYQETLTAAKAVELDKPMNASIKAALKEALDTYGDKTYTTDEEYQEAIDVLETATNKANNSIAAYTHAFEELNKIVAELENTNLYTAEAYKTHITDNLTAYNNGTLTDEEANAITMLAGWHEDNTIDDVLISAWDSNINDWEGLHVNTWSAAGDFGETGFAVPLTEYWVGSGSLTAKTMMATISNVEAGNYKVTADMFVKSFTTPTGISMQVGDASEVSITGTQNGDFFVSEATAFGTVGEDGNLVIKLIVAEGNNTNWIGFKNMKYEKVNVDYSALNAAIATANAVNATINGGVKALSDAIAAAQELLTSADQDAIDEAATTLAAATETAKTTIIARKNLAGVAKKAAALKGYLENDITEDIDAATTYAANPEATAEEADAKADALNANFAEWEVVTLNNGTFDTGLNGELIAPGTEAKPYVHAVDGWTQNFKFTSTAAQGIAAAYGSAAQNGTNDTAAPVADMFGKSEGGTLHLSSGWSDQARYYQEVKDLPAGKYVFYYEGINVNNTTNALNANYFGIGNLTAGDIEGTNDSFKFSDEKNFTYNEWKAVAFDFTLTKTITSANINVGLVGGTAGSANTPKMWFDNVTIYCIDKIAMADADDYAALNAAIEAAEAKTLGFNEGEFAPYNNVDAIKALAMANAIDQEAENPKTDVEAAINAIADDKWTANTEEVNAVYDGDWNLTPANTTSGTHEIKGWTNSGVMRLVLKDMSTYPGLADASKNAAVFTWGSNAISYGNETGYTMPLLADGVYKLEIKVAGWNNGAVGNVNVSVLNEESGLAATDLGGSQKAINQEGSLVSYSKIFKTGEAGNYILTLQANANFVFTDLIIKKAVVEDVTIDEAETYTPTEKYANVTFKRTLVEGWNGLVLPFDMTVNEAKTVFNASAVKDFTGVIYDETKGATLVFSDATDIKAGKPFMIKATAGTEYTYTINNVVLKADKLQSIEQTAGEAKYTMTGTYEKQTGLTNFVLIQGSKYYEFKGEQTASAKPFRAYFKNQSTGVAASKGINFDFGEETDGITQVENTPSNVNNNVYNLQGQKVNRTQRGVYIVNGKKVVIK